VTPEVAEAAMPYARVVESVVEAVDWIRGIARSGRLDRADGARRDGHDWT
jgi:hypothetical protein